MSNTVLSWGKARRQEQMVLTLSCRRWCSSGSPPITHSVLCLYKSVWGALCTIRCSAPETWDRLASFDRRATHCAGTWAPGKSGYRTPSCDLPSCLWRETFQCSKYPVTPPICQTQPFSEVSRVLWRAVAALSVSRYFWSTHVTENVA